MFRFLKDFDFKKKKVLIRCDFNVPIIDGKIGDDFKIQKTLPTINYLREQGAKIILLSHLGEPTKNERKKYSLKPITLDLENKLKIKIKFVKECIGKLAKREIENMKEGEIILLENLRFEQGEKVNDEKFGQNLASLGEVYVNDAFAVCHRKHASVASIPKFLPHFIGLLLEKEIKILSSILEKPKRPLIIIVGGVKIESKIRFIKKFLEFSDHLLVGGQIANILLRSKKICIGKPLPAEEIHKLIEEIDLTNPKLHLPVDVVVAPEKTGETYVRETGVGSIRKEEEAFDIGSDTINLFSTIVKESKTVIWAGPLGYFENEKFEKGTKKIAEIIVQEKENLFSIVGGGDTISAINKFSLLDQMGYTSTGGGAMLAFLTGDELPGLKALMN